MGFTIYAEDLDKKVGSTVLDPFGRKIGILVGFDVELDGRVTKVFVRSLDGREITDYDVEAVKIEGGTVIIKPKWLTQAEKLRDQYIKIVKKLEAVREMYRRNEIPRDLYREFAGKLERRFRSMKEELSKVKDELRRRREELKIELDMIARTRIVLRMSFASGDLSKEAYMKSMEEINNHEEKVKRELSQLEEMLKKLEEIEVKPVSFSEEEEHGKEESGEKSSGEIPASITPQGPIPVKIIE